MTDTTETKPRARKVEVQLQRAYVPADAQPNQAGSFEKIPAGTVVKLPSAEAAGLVRAGIATTTANSFED